MTALVDRLRNKRMRVHDLGGVGFEIDPDCNEAADALEALQAERDALRSALDPFGALIPAAWLAPLPVHLASSPALVPPYRIPRLHDSPDRSVAFRPLKAVAAHSAPNGDTLHFGTAGFAWATRW